MKRPWCWERLRAGGEGDDRGWEGWMASPTHGHGFEWTPGVGDGQGGLASCIPAGCKESDTTEWLNWTATCNLKRNKIWVFRQNLSVVNNQSKWLITLFLYVENLVFCYEIIILSPLQYQLDKLSFCFPQVVSSVYLIELISGTWVFSYELISVFTFLKFHFFMFISKKYSILPHY